MKIICLTNDKAIWATKPFAHLFNKYWGSDQEVTIFGFNYPDFYYPDNFTFVSCDSYNWPAERWTNQLRLALEQTVDDLVIIFLEDYWLCKPVDIAAVRSMYEYAASEPDLLRIDLTNDRSQHKGAFKYHEYNGYDIIRTLQPIKYQMSYQVGVWNRNNLLKLLVPNETAWQSEIEGSKRVPNDMLALGLKEPVVSYIPVLRKNKQGLQGFKKFDKIDQDELLKLIPKDKR